MEELKRNDLVRIWVNNSYKLQGRVVEVNGENVTISVPTYYNNGSMIIDDKIKNIEKIKLDL